MNIRDFGELTCTFSHNIFTVVYMLVPVLLEFSRLLAICKSRNCFIAGSPCSELDSIFL